MAQSSQFGTPAKVAVGGIVVAVIAVAAYFMQPTATPAPIVENPPQQAPNETPVAQTILPTLDIVRISPQGEATIAGRAAPEATVSLRVDGAEIASAPADGAGSYATLFSLPASDKTRILTVAATGTDGLEVMGADQVVIAPTVLDQVAAVEPQQTPTQTPETTAEPATTQTPAPLKITDAGVQVLDAAKIADNIVINSITYETDVVKVGGLGQADQSVRLYVDGADAATTQIAANGTWSASLSQIAPGIYTLRADQLDPDGKVTSRYETPFKRESIENLAAASGTTAPAAASETTPAAQAPAAPPPATVTVQPGLTLWAIAQENFGAGTMYVQVFEANKDQIRDPNLIYPGQVFTIPKQ